MTLTEADPKSLLQEMFQFLPIGSKSTSKHDDVDRFPNERKMVETRCCGSERCENNNTCVIRNTCLCEKGDVINRIEDDSCNAVEFSATTKYSAGVSTVDHCTLSEDVNYNCNCDIMHRQKRKQISQSYSCSIRNLWRIRAEKNLPLPITKKVGTQWRNCFWRTLLFPLVVLLLCTTLCGADSGQCAIGLKTPGSKFYRNCSNC